MVQANFEVNEMLNILSLEDSVPDYEIICDQLVQSGYNLNISRVDKEESFASYLRKNKYDIILADFNLIGFDGFSALNICNEICPETPFICVSGSIGEEKAIELLKIGAVDYVLKDRPQRLPFAIERALKEVKEKNVLQVAEKQLLKLSQAVEQSPASVVITNIEGEIEYVNRKFCEITGYSKEDSIGENPRLLKSGNQSADFYKELWSTISSGQEWVGELLNKKKNGELYWESARISPMVDNSGNIINFIAVKEDITEKKKIWGELILAKEHAEESDRLKSAFLANVSHEIRTPMNGILGFSELLKESGLSGDQQKEYIRVIEKSGERMLNIINDIVDISKIEAGLVTVNISEVNINKKIEFVYKFFKPETEAKGIQLLKHKGLPDSEVIVYTDEEKLFSILTNLVKNASKFTDSGKIEIGYNIVNTETTLSYVEFYVKDTGIGIPKDRQKAVFERFVQADISDSKAFQGAGLGLSISKAYVEMLGGKIWVESEDGKGSEFYFTIPTQNRIPDHFEATSILDSEISNFNKGSIISGLKVLIVEDDKTSELYLRTILKKFTSNILSVQDGLDAVELCKSTSDINLIMMDINMPLMDGYEATRQIRRFNDKVIIVAQTAFALLGDKEKAIEAGCNDYLSKPLDLLGFKVILDKYFRK